MSNRAHLAWVWKASGWADGVELGHSLVSFCSLAGQSGMPLFGPRGSSESSWWALLWRMRLADVRSVR